MPLVKKRNVEQLIDLANLSKPEVLLRQAICKRCGQLMVLDKYCTNCAAKKKKAIEIFRQQEALGFRPKYNELDKAYRLLFEDQTLSREGRGKLHFLTLLFLLRELTAILEPQGNEGISVAQHNQERLARICQAAHKVLNGWAKGYGRRSSKPNPQIILLSKFIAGPFGLTHH